METPDLEESQRSIIIGSGVINADLDFLKGEGKLLHISPGCVIVGLQDCPYMLFATPEFNENNLPPHIIKDLHEVKRIIIKPTFFINSNKENYYFSIPDWLSKFKKVETLRVKYVILDNLTILKDLPIQYLLLENVKFSNLNTILKAIEQLKYLREVFYDKSFSPDITNMSNLYLKYTPILGSVKKVW